MGAPRNGLLYGVIFCQSENYLYQNFTEKKRGKRKEHFDEEENKPKYSVIITKHAHGKDLNFFLICYKREIHHYFLNFFKVSGRSIEEILSR